MNKDVLSKLKNAGLLSEEPESIGFVSTGSYALNKIISGSFTGGIPIGGITQFKGENSSAKTVFLTHILKDAQAKGYYTILIDSENSYNAEFASSLGIDPTQLIYKAPDTLEECFKVIEDLVADIRALDKTTPIIVGYDSIAVSPTKKEIDADNYESDNMIGAHRAKITGAALRKINGRLRKDKIGLVIVNQIRSKVGVMFGSPDTIAAGGKSLEFYLSVDMKTISNKNGDLLKDDLGNVYGVTGRLRNTKNKVTIPYQECEFELIFNKGITPYFGLCDVLIRDGLVDTPSKGWRGLVGFPEVKFREKDLQEILESGGKPEFNKIREALGLHGNIAPSSV
jgi:recombination protein RecA